MHKQLLEKVHEEGRIDVVLHHASMDDAVLVIGRQKLYRRPRWNGAILAGVTPRGAHP